MSASTAVCWTKKTARLRQHILKRKEKADVFPCFFWGETSFENTDEFHYALRSSNSSRSIFCHAQMQILLDFFSKHHPLVVASLLHHRY